MFGFPKVEHTTFEKNFLKTVIFQFTYDKNERINELKGEIKDIFAQAFPRHKDITTSGIQINLDKNETQIVNPINEKNGVELKSDDGNKVLNINDTTFSFTLNGKSYKNYNNLKSDLNQINDFFELCKIKTLNKVAIRKINIVDFTLDDKPVGILNFLFNDNLIGNLNYFPNSPKINHNIQSLNYRDQNNYLNVRYGLNIPNPKASTGQVIIDIDSYKIEKSETSKLYEIADPINDEIFNIFNWLISEEMIEVLKKK